MSKEKQFIETIAQVVKNYSSPLYPSIRIAQACFCLLYTSPSPRD